MIATGVHVLLERHGPCLSSVLRSHLEQAGLSPEAARQQVSRSKSDIRRLSGIRFPHRESFLFLPEQFADESFGQALLCAFDSTNSVYGLAVHSLAARGGIVPRQYFDIISGSPTRLKRHISSDRVLEGLQRANMVTVESSPAIGEYVRLTGVPSEADLSCGGLKAQLTTDEFFLTGLADWLKKLGLVSYYRVDFRSGPRRPIFGQFGWDLTAPSYVHPLVRHRTNERPLPGPFLLLTDLPIRHLEKARIAAFCSQPPSFCSARRLQSGCERSRRHSQMPPAWPPGGQR